MLLICSRRRIDSIKDLLTVALLASIAFTFFSPYANAEIYKWRDSNGVLHFSERPPAQGDAEAITATPANVTAPVAVNGDDAGTHRSERKVTHEPVVMYATSWCPYCAKARDYFKEKGIHYTEYDVEKSPARMREFKRLGGTGYPLILIGKNEKMQGFSVAAFERRYYKQP